jgi:hypothetical protein
MGCSGRGTSEGSGVERWFSPLQGQHPDAIPTFIRNDQGTAPDGFPIAVEEIDHQGPDTFREHIETTNLNDARSTAS